MTMRRQSLGTVLTSAREILMNGATPAEVLRDVDVPAWYLAELEHDHITRPNEDLLTLICQAYELAPADVADLRQSPQLTTDLTELAGQRDQATATFLRQQRLDWPDSAWAAKQPGSLNQTDPAANHNYADILRCLRIQIDHDPVMAASVYYRLSPMAYWQMEAAQLAITDEVERLLCYRLEVEDLSRFFYVDDLFSALCGQLDICKYSLEPVKMPGNY